MVHTSIHLPSYPRERALALVRFLGPHPARLLDLDLDTPDEATLGGWLCAAILLARRGAEPRALAAFRELSKRGLAAPGAIAVSNVLALEEVLVEAQLPRPDVAAAVLHRASRALCETYTDGLTGLAARAEGMEDLGGRLARLAPGFGRAAVTRFLQPLRECWAAADELPLEPAAKAAAAHMGWISEDAEEVSAAELRGVLGLHGAGEAPPDDGLRFRDVEAGLTRLGRAACLKRTTRSCLLGTDCPLGVGDA
jgi:hypothetical protein